MCDDFVLALALGPAGVPRAGVHRWGGVVDHSETAKAILAATTDDSLVGRPSIPREKLRTMLLQAFHSIRSERLEYDLLFRGFVVIGIGDAARDHSVFSNNRGRLLEGDIAAKFPAAVLAQPRICRAITSRFVSR